jgi:hypothetical protein
MARKGKDELDLLQSYRKQAGAARDYMKKSVWGGQASGGALKAINEMFGSTAAAEEVMGKDIAKRSSLLARVDEGRANLGRLAGSSKGTGIVQKSTSPNIPRTDQGIRNLPKTKIMGESAEERIMTRPPRNTGKDTPPSRSVSPRGIARPKDEAYFAMRRSEKTIGKIAEAKSIGKEISTARTSLSKSLINMIEAEGLDVGSAQKNKAYELAGGAVSNRDRARLGIPKVGKNLTGGKGRVSQPVQPSVAPKAKAPNIANGSLFEPRTQKGTQGIPKAFKGAFGLGLVAGGLGGAFGGTNPVDAGQIFKESNGRGGAGGRRPGGKKNKL